MVSSSTSFCCLCLLTFHSQIGGLNDDIDTFPHIPRKPLPAPRLDGGHYYCYTSVFFLNTLYRTGLRAVTAKYSMFLLFTPCFVASLPLQENYYQQLEHRTNGTAVHSSFISNGVHDIGNSKMAPTSRHHASISRRLACLHLACNLGKVTQHRRA